MAEPPPDDAYSDEEARRRFEALVRAALNTPPQPLKDRPPHAPEAGPRRKRRKRLKPPPAAS